MNYQHYPPVKGKALLCEVTIYIVLVVVLIIKGVGNIYRKAKGAT